MMNKLLPYRRAGSIPNILEFQKPDFHWRDIDPQIKTNKKTKRGKYCGSIHD